MENAILITTIKNDIYLKPLGHITANLCFPLREMIFKKLYCFHVLFNIYIDLSETRYMDSTFLGIMVGIDKRLHAHLKTHLYILNPNEISYKLLKNMGLDRFLQIIAKKLPDDISYTKFDEEVSIDEIEKTKIVLNSHKELTFLSEKNKKRFETLTNLLENQLNKKVK